MDFDETWQEASPQRPLSNLCFSCRSEIQDCRPGLWLAETFFGFFFTTAELILTKLDRKQVLNTLYQVCVFHAYRKSKIAALASDWLKHFLTFSATAEWILTKLDRKQVLNALYQICVFRADQKSKIAALASDWLKHFSASSSQPLNWFWRNLTGSKSSIPSIKFVFFMPIENPRLPPWPLIGWNIFWPSLQLLNGFWRNLTGNKSSTSSTKFVLFFVPIRNPSWPPWPLIGWNIFRLLLYNRWMDLTKFDRKQILNTLYQVFVFRADRKSEMAALASDWLKHFSTSSPQVLNGFWRNLTGSNSSKLSIKFVFFVPFRNPRSPPWPPIGWHIFRLLLRNRWMGFDETWQEVSPQRPLSSLWFFFVSIRNPRWPPWPLIGWNIFRLLLHNRWMDFNETW